MTWERTGTGVSTLTWVGDTPPTPAKGEGWAYAYCATPLEERQHPTSCGRPNGHAAHRRLDEPVCEDCRRANNAYAKDRNAAARAARATRKDTHTP